MYLKAHIKDPEAFQKIREAVAFLLRKATLCGLCLLDESVKIREHNGINYGATDYTHVFYNPKWVKSVPVRDVAFVLMHEWLHIFLRHDLRQGTRVHLRWNFATDYTINRTCSTALEMGTPDYLLEPPDEYKDLDAEAIYDRLPNLPPSENSRVDLLAPVDSKEQRNVRLREMAERAKLMLKDRPPLGPASKEWVQDRLNDLKKVVLPWDRMWLSNIYKDFGGSTIDYRRPRKAYLPYAWIPRSSRQASLHLFLAIDISGSMGAEEIARAAFVLDRAAKRATQITVVTFDAMIREHYKEKNPSEVLKKVKFKQGAHSHTSALEVFDLIKKERPSSVSIITDGYIYYPDKPFPEVNWILTAQHRPPSWGRKFVMQDS